ncbi:MAG: hypothetical protein KDE31_26555, partial [Caldilineaceae bacterium]|nr:hypothetical protein [Caldilineaceae bacterium]
MNRFVKLLSILAVLSMVMAACAAPSGAPAPADEAAATAPAAEEGGEAAAPSGDVITLEFWHAMGGNLGELVDELVARFNDSQDGIVVNATYQGSYDDTY